MDRTDLWREHVKSQNEQETYTLGVQRSFQASHYLVGGDWGAENQPHAHEYVVEIQVEAHSLNAHGYLVDIVDVEVALDQLVKDYQNKRLNELPEFSGLNPSIEHFARILCDRFTEKVDAGALSAIAVKIWESRIAWCAFRRECR